MNLHQRHQGGKMEKEHQKRSELMMERQRGDSQAGGSGRGHVTVIRIGADQEEVKGDKGGSLD